MNKYEKNVYTNLFEYPTKHIVKLELENEEKDKEIERLNNIINGFETWVIKGVKDEKMDLYFQGIRIIDILDKLKELKGSD